MTDLARKQIAESQRLDKHYYAVARSGYDATTGERFPSINGYARQESTGKGFANIDADRTASGWKQFREYRRNHFAVLRGAIFTA